jgi:hypothetical protein
MVEGRKYTTFLISEYSLYVPIRLLFIFFFNLYSREKFVKFYGNLGKGGSRKGREMGNGGMGDGNKESMGGGMGEGKGEKRGNVQVLGKNYNQAYNTHFCNLIPYCTM